MCLPVCPHQCLGTKWAGGTHTEQAQQEADASVPAQARSSATQLCGTLHVHWMGFPQAQEPANSRLRKVPSIFHATIRLSSAAPGATLWA